ncbi:unnamed protein product [Hydatigera taeniaeformis]|uniref:Uncharacterized protein n=1 Tax=Hydatigena taeniaeformis TaxID=6205 RepID=A0A0R3XDB8_HYDTA|nr:unnamed protein product [Hydatigera taeniaeformis]
MRLRAWWEKRWQELENAEEEEEEEEERRTHGATQIRCRNRRDHSKRDNERRRFDDTYFTDAEFINKFVQRTCATLVTVA